MDDNTPRIRLVQCTHYLQQRGLSGTAGTNDAHYLTLAYMEVYATEHLQRTKALGYISQFYHIVLDLSSVPCSIRRSQP